MSKEIGIEYIENVFERTKIFCQEMQMTSEQQDAFKDLIKMMVKYIINTSVDCANAVGGTRQILKDYEE